MLHFQACPSHSCCQSSMRVRFSTAGAELHRDFHSTPDLAQSSRLVTNTMDVHAPKGHRSQEDVTMLLLLNGGVVTGRPPLPPPTHPPPPPPVGQLVRTIRQWGCWLNKSFLCCKTNRCCNRPLTFVQTSKERNF